MLQGNKFRGWGMMMRRRRVRLMGRQRKEGECRSLHLWFSQTLSRSAKEKSGGMRIVPTQGGKQNCSQGGDHEIQLPGVIRDQEETEGVGAGESQGAKCLWRPLKNWPSTLAKTDASKRFGSRCQAVKRGGSLHPTVAQAHRKTSLS